MTELAGVAKYSPRDALCIALSVLFCCWILVAGSCGSNPSAEAAFEAKVVTSNELTAKVTYDASIKDPESDEVNGIVEVASRPPDRRVDILREGTKHSIILLDGQLLECESACHIVPEDSRLAVLDSLKLVDVALHFSEIVAADGTEGLAVDELPDRTVAGFDSKCFGTKWRGLTTETCFSGSGVLVLSDVADPGTGFRMLLQATSVHFEVNDDDLSPDYPVGDKAS